MKMLMVPTAGCVLRILLRISQPSQDLTPVPAIPHRPKGSSPDHLPSTSLSKATIYKPSLGETIEKKAKEEKKEKKKNVR